MSQAVAVNPSMPFSLGRSFVHPLFDYMIIGGGLSLGVVAWAVWDGVSAVAAIGVSIPLLVLLCNDAHLAASTVRLYTKPGAFQDLPFLTMVFPLFLIISLTVSIALAKYAGRHLDALYLTWSPYHYAAQAYGLAVMYCYRSGCQLSSGEKRLLWWSCMLPFLSNFFDAPDAGLGWFVPHSKLAAHPILAEGYNWLTSGLALLTFVVPVVLFLRLQYHKSAAMPLISLLIMGSNGLWWIVLNYLDAFVWATVFHGLQYLGIVTIFHVKDQTRAPNNQRGWLYHTVKFYSICVLLGYGMFMCWPRAYVLAGYGLAESMALVIAVINIHHFIVDAYIWRLRKDPNYRTVTDGTI